MDPTQPHGYCIDLFHHSQVIWPRDAQGIYQCPFDGLILEPTWTERPPAEPDNTLPEPEPVPTPHEAAGGVPIYWDHGPDVVTSFDDFERVAQEYSVYGDPGDARAYTDEENLRAEALINHAAVKQAQADLDRAIQVNAAPAELQALQEATLAEEGIESGDPWRQPTGAHDAYPIDAIVTHQGSTWQSTVPANVWEPGVSGWRPVGEGPQPWVQPTGAHDAYNTGDLVTHEGKTWRSNIDANVWEPPEQWTEVPPDE